MPDESDRIRESSIKSMNNILLALQSFDDDTDVNKHPRITIIFNNVSKHGDIIDIDEIESDSSNSVKDETTASNNEKRIEDLKFQLKEGAKGLYLVEQVSDATKIG